MPDAACQSVEGLAVGRSVGSAGETASLVLEGTEVDGRDGGVLPDPMLPDRDAALPGKAFASGVDEMFCIRRLGCADPTAARFRGAAARSGRSFGDSVIDHFRIGSR